MFISVLPWHTHEKSQDGLVENHIYIRACSDSGIIDNISELLMRLAYKMMHQNCRPVLHIKILFQKINISPKLWDNDDF